MLSTVSDASQWIKALHLIGSVLALFLTWAVTHIVFGLQHMRHYYDSTPAIPGDPSPDLQFPAREIPDFWDFMYYSFTIAICYQTSDVTISAPDSRRLTPFPAIFSFIHVALLPGSLDLRAGHPQSPTGSRLATSAAPSCRR